MQSYKKYCLVQHFGATMVQHFGYFNTFEEIADYTVSIAKEGDLIITLGCGDIYKAAKMMIERLDK